MADPSQRNRVLPVAGISGPQLSIRWKRPNGVLFGRVPVGLRTSAGTYRPDLWRVCRTHLRGGGKGSDRAASKVEDWRKLFKRVADESPHRATEQDSGGELSGVLDGHTGCGARAYLPGGSEALRAGRELAKSDDGAVAVQSHGGNQPGVVHSESDGG